MASEKTDIIIDSKEASKHPSLLDALRPYLGIKIEPLAVGDYILLASAGKKPLIIERKSPTDLVQGLKGRLWPQLEQLAAVREEADIALVIVGYLPIIRKLTKWQESAVARLIDEIALSWKIPIIPCPDERWFISWLIAKSKSLGRPEEKRYYSTHDKKRPETMDDKILYVVESFAGPKIALELLKKFKSVANICSASPEDLFIPNLIGEKRAQEIWTILHSEWSSGDI